MDAVKTLPAIVVIGGGTGSFAVLQGLKTLTPDITALVGMMDDGGSTGVLRDELGVLPPGDVRQCLVALSEAPLNLRELFNFRFEQGTFSGHSFGNLFLSAVEKMTDDFSDAARLAGEVLRITGQVLPLTTDDARLVLRGRDGSEVHGEHAIDVLNFTPEQRRPQLRLEPAAAINPAAAAAIARADFIVIAPGDLYTSLGPSLLIDGVGPALHAASAPILYLCNLVVKPGHTAGMSVADHAAEIERFAGGPLLDHVMYNTAHPLPALAKRYASEGEVAVEVRPEEFESVGYRAHGRPLLAPQSPRQPKSGAGHFGVPRSFIRHDASAIAFAVRELL